MNPEKINEYRDGGEGFIKWAEENVRLQIPAAHTGTRSTVYKWVTIKDLPTDKHPKTGRSWRNFWDKQKEVLREAVRMQDGEFIHRLIVLCWERGEGKCEAKGSEVLMYDGTIKKVEDVKVGDLLMGDDNTPREVLSLANGTEEMYEVIPNRGESKVVTGDHILSLKRADIKRRKRNLEYDYVDKNAGKIVDISVNDYLKQSDYFKRMHYLYRTPIDWPEQEVPIDPYFLGLWLGDGHSHVPSVTTMDQEIVDYVYQFAESFSSTTNKGLGITVKEKQDDKENKAKEYHFTDDIHPMINRLLDDLRDNDLIYNKHIPQVYLSNSRDVRLRLLAGLVDSDGCRNRNSIQFTIKDKKLSDGILFLARSLGFHAEVNMSTKTIKSSGFSGQYYRIGISGDCSIIPSIVPRKKCRPRSNFKDILVTGIKEIKPAGEREYYGFVLDGNGRYVTGDFTVTHNSLLVCLIQLWKFFCFPNQNIVLGALSKDQVRFVHYDIMRDIILNSPNLLRVIGKANIKEKNMVLRNKHGNVISSIMAISSFSGIVSNITGYTFSEFFDMSNPKFFTQLDGSTRNIPNALGTIDSTVSSKEHTLYKLYRNYLEQTDSTLFFHHRCSPEADYRDFWSPKATQTQINAYASRFPPADFDRYFRNTWELAKGKLFPPEIVDSIFYVGADEEIGNTETVKRLCDEKQKALQAMENSGSDNVDPKKSKRTKGTDQNLTYQEKINIIESRLYSTDRVYQLGQGGLPRLATVEELNKIGELFDTDWAILAGIDRSDPMARESYARTIVTFVAKGLVGSRSNKIIQTDENNVPHYLYFIIGLWNVEDASLEGIKSILNEAIDEYGGLDSLCAERWGCFDLAPWCEEKDIPFETVFPSLEKQKASFTELYVVARNGRLKSPAIQVPGYTQENIMEEEMKIFDFDPKTNWYGSPQKNDKQGIQDDSIFSLAWAVYGGRNITVDNLRKLNKGIVFGEYHSNRRNLYGVY